MWMWKYHLHVPYFDIVQCSNNTLVSHFYICMCTVWYLLKTIVIFIAIQNLSCSIACAPKIRCCAIGNCAVYTSTHGDLGIISPCRALVEKSHSMPSPPLLTDAQQFLVPLLYTLRATAFPWKSLREGLGVLARSCSMNMRKKGW